MSFTLCIAALCGCGSNSTTAAPSNPPSAGPYTSFSSYYVLPYVGSPNFKSLTTTLKVTASLATTTSGTGTNKSFTVDTGSTGIVVPATEVAGYVNGTGTPGSLTYSSSGLKLTGYWTTAVVSFPNAVNQSGVSSTVTATLPVLAVTSGTCLGGGVNSSGCTGTIPHELGVGFGRGTDTYASPVYNPFVNLTEMTAGTMRRGYILTAAGIQLGLTNATAPLGQTFGTATANTFTAEQLTASGAFPGYPYDWNSAPGSFVYAGTATARGDVLFDTGLTDMILEDVSHPSGTVVPSGTAVTIDAMPANSATDTPLVSYSFASGDGGAATPSSVTWALYSSSRGPFVNVGIHILGKYDYLYDADGGILGLRPVTR